MEIKNPFDLLVDQIRQVVREEIAAAMGADLARKEWLRASECSELFGLPPTWFEEAGREGKIERTKPGRNVLFKRRSIEHFLETKKNGGTA